MATDNQGSAIASQLNSKYISIKPENGEVFNSGQKIIYNIEPSIGYIKRDSYLVLDIINKTADNGRYGLTQAGAHGLIEQINIYSKETGILLENLNHYNQWVGIETQYETDDKTQLAIKEGVATPTRAREHHFTGGGAFASEVQLLQPHNISNNLLSPINNLASPQYMEKRYCIPLRCGIFRHWDDEKLIPILNFGGLRIELILAKPEQALRRICCDIINANEPSGHTQVDLVRTGKTLQTRAGGDNVLVIANTTIDKCVFAIGNAVCLNADIAASGAITDTFRLITAIAQNGANVDITISGGAIGATTTAARLFVDVPASVGGVKSSGAGVAPSYQITNTEYKLCVVAPTPEQAKSLTGAINYEFTSYDIFMDNIPATSLRHQVPIHSVASKAKCLMTMIYDASAENFVNHQNYYAGLQDYSAPQTSYINELVYFINNKLYPLRAYNPKRHNDRVLTLNELVKAFNSINTPVMSLGEGSGTQLEDYANTFLVCRELARGNFVFDLRNAEPELRLNFDAVRPQNMRVITFAWSKKIISTSSSGVQVIY